MINLIRDNLPELINLCRRHRVARFEVFGSAATGDFDPDRSDLDFLVDFGDMPGHERFDAYFDLLDDLRSLFGREIDLVESQAIRNPWFKRRVNESREELYAA